MLPNHFLDTAVLLCLLLSVSLATAQQRTSHEAGTEALRILHAKGIDTREVAPMRTPAASLSEARALREADGRQEEPYYIFDSAEGDAFVIVAGDRRMPALLGWSDQSSFPSDDIPAGLSWLLDYYACWHALLATGSLPGDSTDASFNDYPLVEPLLNTRWGQSSPYYLLCPKKDNAYCATGCVATAMAQIMYYYRYPTVGKGSLAYLSGEDGLACAFDFGATTFDWESMRADYTSRCTESERQAVAELMYACGVSVGMTYDPAGSGAYSENIPYALHHFFGYNPYIAHYVRDYFPENEWHRMLCTELREGRPVLYCGTRSGNVGHAFVVDGCDGDGCYHINWGWTGTADGYFSLDGFSPLGGEPYSMYQDMTCRIYPGTLGGYEDNFYADSIVVQDGPIALGDTLHIEVLEVCSRDNCFSTIDSTLCFAGTVGIGLYNDKMEFVQWLDVPDDITANLYVAYKLWYEIPMDARVFTDEHVWWLVPVVQGVQASTPTPMHLKNTTRARIPLRVRDGIAHIGAEHVPETGVNIIPAIPSVDVYYDLQGRPCAHPSQGVYIFKGKKLVF